ATSGRSRSSAEASATFRATLPFPRRIAPGSGSSGPCCKKHRFTPRAYAANEPDRIPLSKRVERRHDEAEATAGRGANSVARSGGACWRRVQPKCRNSTNWQQSARGIGAPPSSGVRSSACGNDGTRRPGVESSQEGEGVDRRECSSARRRRLVRIAEALALLNAKCEGR